MKRNQSTGFFNFKLGSLFLTALTDGQVDVNHIARVILNDKELGVVWTAPWRIRIPKRLLHLKANLLRIEITNVWANRLIGEDHSVSL